MDIALEVWSSDYDQVLATCQRAEALGFSAFYYGESPHDLNLECWSTLAALAEATSTIRLGPVITNVLSTYRNPTLLIRQAAAVNAISDRRLDFRTGVGAAAVFGRAWWQPAGVAYPAYEQRLTDLSAALVLLESELPDVPITIAATGSRAMALAARFADVWETSFCTPDEFVVRHGAVQAIEDRRTLTRSLEIDGFVATDPAHLKRLMKRLEADRGRREDLDAILTRALVGTPVQVAAQLAGLATVGVDQVVVALHDPTDPHALEALAKAVTVARLPT